MYLLYGTVQFVGARKWTRLVIPVYTANRMTHTYILMVMNNLWAEVLKIEPLCPCVIPENIQTSLMEGISLRTPHPSGNSTKASYLPLYFLILDCNPFCGQCMNIFWNSTIALLLYYLVWIQLPVFVTNCP